MTDSTEQQLAELQRLGLKPRGGGDPTVDPNPTDPKSLADLVPRTPAGRTWHSDDE